MIAHYWYMEVIYAVVLVATGVLVYLLRNRPDISYKIAYCIAVFLFLTKVLQYVSKALAGFDYPFPVEMSAVAYFVYGIIITFKIKKLEEIAVFFGFTAGVFYIFSVFISPASHVAIFEQTLQMNGSDYALYHAQDELLTLFNHTSMFVGSTLMLCNVRKFNWKKHWALFLAFCLEVIYVWVIYEFTDYSLTRGKPLFCQITDGQVLSYVIPDLVMSPKVSVIWLGITTPLLFGFIALFYFINNKMAKLRVKNKIVADYYPQKIESTYRIS